MPSPAGAEPTLAAQQRQEQRWARSHPCTSTTGEMAFWADTAACPASQPLVHLAQGAGKQKRKGSFCIHRTSPKITLKM